MTEWDPVDILTCLEVEPEVDEDATWYGYSLSRDGLVVTLNVWPYDSDVWITIRLADQQEPLVDLRMEGCRALRYRREGEREELYFVSFDEGSRYPVNVRGGWRLRVRPRIKLELGHPPGG